MRVQIAEGEYDHVMQTLMDMAEQNTPVDTLVFLPWHQRLLGSGDRPAAQRVEDELAFWRQAWALAADKLRARIVQVGYDCEHAGPMGFHLSGVGDGRIALVRKTNEAIRHALPAGAYFVDLSRIAGDTGRQTFYDARRYHWTKQPFSEAGTVLLARHTAAGISALTTGPKKVLVLDLDNTVWGGVVGETGPLGIALGESPDGQAFVAFQHYIRALGRRGVVLAVCSKNNPDDAREPFLKHPDMVLRLDDFAAFEASWDPKPIAIQRIAETLRLGLDSFVFFDDNPAEREHVRQALPQVEVVDVPEDPADYISALEAGLWFEAARLTDEDTQRAEQYAAERRRRESQQSFTNMEDYLTSLEMVATVRDIDEPDMARVVQLLGKTNQFNLTTRRHSADTVRTMLATPGVIGLTLRLRDRFGDHGLVSVLIGLPGDNGNLVIDTWLMSCRVIGRTVEQFLFNCLLSRASRCGYHSIQGEYLPTAKNALVRDLYDRLGFTRLSQDTDGRVTYQLSVADALPAPTCIRSDEADQG